MVLPEEIPEAKEKDKWNFLLIPLAFLMIGFFIGDLTGNQQTPEMKVLQDLNSSLIEGRQADLNEHQILAQLIVQGAMLNAQFDVNDQLAWEFQNYCQPVSQDENGIVYYACKVGK